MSARDKILDRQIRKWELEKAAQAHEREAREKPGALLAPVITVSRQRGSGGTVLAEKLAERFGYTLLHRDIIDRIVESSGFKRRIIESLDEHSKSQLQIFFESMLQGAYVDASDYMKQLIEVIYSISQLGGVVVVGRGANFILGPDRGFHIRIGAPRAARVKTLVAREQMSEREALHEVERTDHERAEFMRKMYGRDIDDPLGYDLVINNISISMDSVTSLVAAAAQEKFERIRAAAHHARQPA